MLVIQPHVYKSHCKPTPILWKGEGTRNEHAPVMLMSGAQKGSAPARSEGTRDRDTARSSLHVQFISMNVYKFTLRDSRLGFIVSLHIVLLTCIKLKL